jgi:hypothetical protein
VSAFLSLALFVAALWANRRSYGVCDRAYHISDPTPGSSHVAIQDLVSYQGHLWFIFSDEHLPGDPPIRHRWNFAMRTDPGDDHLAHGELAGISSPRGWRIHVSDTTHFPAADNYRLAVIPYRLLLAATLLLPALWMLSLLIRISRRNRREAFCCQFGYDLRATPNRCPECGT